MPHRLTAHVTGGVYTPHTMSHPNLLREAVDILMPHVGGGTAEREALLSLAFYGVPGLAYGFEVAGKPQVFAVNCLKTLFDYGYLPPGAGATADGAPCHAVAALLGVLEVGVEGQTRIARLVANIEAREPSPRKVEIGYLEWLREQYLLNMAQYTPLALRAQVPAVAPAAEARLRPVIASPALALLRAGVGEVAEPARQAEPETFEDIGDALGAVARPLPGAARRRHAVLLGEPGAGKSTTLLKLADGLIDAAIADSAAPLPLYVRLGRWTDDRPLERFMADELGPLGGHLSSLLASLRGVLLLDGLNEMPAALRGEKAKAIRDALLEGHPERMAVVTCRTLDYGALDLGVDRIEIREMDPPRIKAFIDNHLAPAGRDGADLFWTLAGGEAVYDAWLAWQRAGATLEQFWTAADVPTADPDVFHETTGNQDKAWRDAVHGQRSLMALASNPFMLTMLIAVYLDTGRVPENRGDLMRRFVRVLLAREGLLERVSDTEWGPPTPEGHGVLAALGDLAWAMQARQVEVVEDERGAMPEAPIDTVAHLLSAEQRHRAASASLLVVGEYVRFVHHLLHEHFVALRMRERLPAPIGDGTLAAAELWPPERWWERTGWEEAAIQLAGLYADDCSPVLRWVAAANPEVAAQCVLRGGARVADATLEALRDAWIPRLTDTGGDPMPEARAAVGRALGMLTLNDLPLDNRPGVSVVWDSRTGRRIPDIAWVEVPEGPFIFQNGEQLWLPAFSIARYPVTCAQFQAFVDDPGGYADDRWWEGLAERPAAPAEAAWPIANHPREGVAWFEAVAFCRWLSDALGYEVRLPTEREWEKAARGTDGREYPWGDGYVEGRANIDETDRFGLWSQLNGFVKGRHFVGQTNAAGIYPDGATPSGICDLSGNVWEWTATGHGSEHDEEPEHVDRMSGRVVRGGSWLSPSDSASAAFRDWSFPDSHDNDVGVRLAVSALISVSR